MLNIGLDKSLSLAYSQQYMSTQWKLLPTIWVKENELEM
ncbi:hypothetical protein D1AOALGA4SA_11162 [Olavius algarvensis Delta 1 endosymbiont]|nr:hypothetical protein D1AOALGA4SA_11162 [Olavius algarvensis Delta 1 endosymbiont]